VDRSRASLVVMCILGISVAVGAGWLGWSGSSKENDTAVQVLAADPMAGKSWPGAALAFSEDTSRVDSDPLTGKPRSSRVMRSFTPSGVTPEALVQEICRGAKDAGWLIDTCGDRDFEGVKRMSFGKARLHVSVNKYLDPVEVVAILEPQDPNR
jgi:hypothetical protein